MDDAPRQAVGTSILSIINLSHNNSNTHLKLCWS